MLCHYIFFLHDALHREGSSIKISGSGVIISKDGYLLTNAHVVDKTKKVTITLSNGRVYKSKVVAVDELTDLAVVKADIGSDILPAAPGSFLYLYIFYHLLHMFLYMLFVFFVWFLCAFLI